MQASENSTTTGDAVIAAFHEQASLCRRFGSDFTARVLGAFAHVIDRSTTLGVSVLSWKGLPGAMNDALPLRVSAGLHALARTGRVPELTAVYPDNPAPTDTALCDALAVAIAREDDWLTAWLAAAPQTNEVGRSACLYLGLMTVAARCDLPIRLFEIGSSGGLNLNLDRYAYDFGGLATGDPDSPLRIAPDWTGAPPEGRAPRICTRRGNDLAPVDLSDPAQRERLLAYFWPDQAERMTRAGHAVDIAAADPPPIDGGDAVEWVQRNVLLPENTGAATVLMHSVTWGYIPPAGRDAITAHMERLGTEATAERPLAWVAFELGEGVQPALRLRYWPSGAEELLAAAHTHCWWIDWKPA